MKKMSGSYKGDLTVQEDTILEGLIAGRVVVPSPFTFDIRGTVDGDVAVLAGATTFVRGVIDGLLTNNGARVEIWGVVDRLKDVSNAMPTVIHPKAIVKTRL